MTGPRQRQWPRRALSDLGTLTDGDWILAADYSDAGVRLLQVGDVGRGVFIGKSSRYVSLERARALGCTFLRPGDVLISRMPDPIGRACILPDLGYPAITAVDVTIWRPDPAYVDPEFAVAYLNSDEWFEEVRRHASGSTRQRISRSKLERLAIPAPHASVQRATAQKIAAALRHVRVARDGMIEQLENATLLSTAEMRRVFSGSVPVQVRMPAERPQGGWRWRRLTDVARLESGHTPSRRHPEWWGGDVPWIALPDIRAMDGKLALETAEYTNEQGIANSSARVLPTHTVVMSRTASVGFVTIMGRPMATSQDFVNWVCGPEIDPFFLAYALRASREYIRGFASGAVHKTIYMPTLHSLQVCMPPIEEQRRIVAELDTRLAEAERLRAALATRLKQIERLPSAILRAAFTPPRAAGAPAASGADIAVLPELVHA